MIGELKSQKGRYSSILVWLGCYNEKNHKFTVDNCLAGEVYVLVLDPDGKPVEQAQDEDEIGVWVDSIENTVKINVVGQSKDDSRIAEFLPSGKYTVKVTCITDVSNKVSKKALSDVVFTVEDNTQKVTFYSVRNRKTSVNVNGSNDLESIKTIVVDCLRFRLNGNDWTSLQEEMIKDVDYYVGDDFVVIHDVEFVVPYGEDNALSYKQVVTDIDESIDMVE